MRSQGPRRKVGPHHPVVPMWRWLRERAVVIAVLPIAVVMGAMAIGMVWGLGWVGLGCLGLLSLLAIKRAERGTYLILRDPRAPGMTFESPHAKEMEAEVQRGLEAHLARRGTTPEAEDAKRALRFYIAKTFAIAAALLGFGMAFLH